MSGHTPGPWKAAPSDSENDLDRTAYPFDVRTADGEWGIASIWFQSGGRSDGSEDEANARLIAAAPELLDALTALANEADGFLSMADRETHGNTNIAILKQRIESARAVIAKAAKEIA